MGLELAEAPDVSTLAGMLRNTTWRLAGEGGELGILFSGGLDSSLLAWILRDRPRTRLFTIGTPGSRDLAAARRAAELVALPWTGVEIGAPELRAEWARWSPILATRSEPSRSVQFSLAVAFDSASTRDLLLGQGADELFWGYARFDRLDATAGAEEARAALRSLTEIELPLTRSIASRAGRSPSFPYLEPSWVEAVLRMPAESHVPAPERKPLLRRIAAALGLPEPLLASPKKAIQYGSGIAKALRSLTGRRGWGDATP
jgi:asparagine synthase (glutamine-hydrolysing)